MGVGLKSKKQTQRQQQKNTIIISIDAEKTFDKRVQNLRGPEVQAKEQVEAWKIVAMPKAGR